MEGCNMLSSPFLFRLQYFSMDSFRSINIFHSTLIFFFFFFNILSILFLILNQTPERKALSMLAFLALLGIVRGAFVFPYEVPLASTFNYTVISEIASVRAVAFLPDQEACTGMPKISIADAGTG